MFNKENAEKIQKNLKEKSYLLAEETKNYINNSIIKKYYYKSDNIKKDHDIKMKKEGYILLEDRVELIYGDLNNIENNMYIPMSIYVKTL